MKGVVRGRLGSGFAAQSRESQERFAPGAQAADGRPTSTDARDFDMSAKSMEVSHMAILPPAKEIDNRSQGRIFAPRFAVAMARLGTRSFATIQRAGRRVSSLGRVRHFRGQSWGLARRGTRNAGEVQTFGRPGYGSPRPSARARRTPLRASAAWAFDRPPACRKRRSLPGHRAAGAKAHAR